jgi:hypothetical protein
MTNASANFAPVFIRVVFFRAAFSDNYIQKNRPQFSRFKYHAQNLKGIYEKYNDFKIQKIYKIKLIASNKRIPGTPKRPAINVVKIFIAIKIPLNLPIAFTMKSKINPKNPLNISLKIR